MVQTFTSVFYEENQEAANKRLTDLRDTDKYPEIKAYIIQEKDGSWRVLRKVRIIPPPPDPVEICRQRLTLLKSQRRKRR